METALISATILISGTVQGVFFRASTVDKARALSLTGWVRNTPEGQVQALCEGPEAQVHSFIDWCKRGPSSAKVQQVTVEIIPYTGQFDAFDITR